MNALEKKNNLFVPQKQNKQLVMSVMFSEEQFFFYNNCLNLF